MAEDEADNLRGPILNPTCEPPRRSPLPCAFLGTLRLNIGICLKSYSRLLIAEETRIILFLIKGNVWSIFLSSLGVLKQIVEGPFIS